MGLWLGRHVYILFDFSSPFFEQKQPHKLRYIVGIILSENGSPTNAEHLKLLEENNYRFATFPSIDHAVQTRFPFKSTISIIVAIMKVYPSLREYIGKYSHFVLKF